MARSEQLLIIVNSEIMRFWEAHPDTVGERRVGAIASKIVAAWEDRKLITYFHITGKRTFSQRNIAMEWETLSAATKSSFNLQETQAAKNTVFRYACNIVDAMVKVATEVREALAKHDMAVSMDATTIGIVFRLVRQPARDRLDAMLAAAFGPSDPPATEASASASWSQNRTQTPKRRRPSSSNPEDHSASKSESTEDETSEDTDSEMASEGCPSAHSEEEDF